MADFAKVERAAAIALRMTPTSIRLLRSHLEQALAREIEFALAAGNTDTLPVLDRLRDVAGMLPDPRITILLQARKDRIYVRS